MAAAVLIAGGLRIFLPPQLRLNDARPLFVVVLAVLMVALIVGDPGRIDRQKTWLRVLTGVLIGVITLVNAGSSVRLVYAIITTQPFTNDANILLVSGAVIWLTNMIAFGLWYWDLDRGGAAARALGTGTGTARHSCSRRCRTRNSSGSAGIRRSWITSTCPTALPWHSARRTSRR